MRSTDLEFCYTLETASLFGLTNRHGPHGDGCGCPAELVAASAAVAAGRSPHYADPDVVGLRTVRRLRRGWTPWWLRPLSRTGVLLAWMLAGCVGVWVSRHTSWAWAVPAVLTVRMLVGWGRLLGAATVRRISSASTRSVVLAPRLIGAPDLVATLAAYAHLIDARTRMLQARLGSGHAGDFDREATRLLFAAADAARVAGTYARLATVTGAVSSRPLGAYFDVSSVPPRPRVELVRAGDGSYLDPTLGRVADGLRACVRHLDDLALLVGWHPVRGGVQPAEPAGRPALPPDALP